MNYREGLIWDPAAVLKATGPVFYEVADTACRTFQKYID